MICSVFILILCYFNSIKVRLELIVLSLNLIMLTYFNSIKVRLEPPLFPEHRPALQFQFHKGAIRTLYFHVSIAQVFHFNSIKVRLERLPLPFLGNMNIRFQFHKGAIRTPFPCACTFAVDEFQFHKGAIRTLSGLTPMRRLKYFNSIKVRLELLAL